MERRAAMKKYITRLLLLIAFVVLFAIGSYISWVAYGRPLKVDSCLSLFGIILYILSFEMLTAFFNTK